MNPILAEYSYTDEAGQELYQNVRLQPMKQGEKPFQVRHRNGTGWENNWNGCRHVLYRLREVLGAIAFGETVYLCEGEKDVHTLEQHHLTATTNACGALAWEIGYSEMLSGADVVILQDNDPSGRQRSAKIPPELCSYAKTIKIVDFAPYWESLFQEKMPDKADVTDFFEKGGLLGDFLAIVDEVPFYQPVPVKEETSEELESSHFQNHIHPVAEIPLVLLEPLIPGFLYKNGITLLCSFPGIGKTTLLCECSYELTYGGSVLGRKVNEAVNVLWLSFDMEPGRIQPIIQEYGPFPSNLLVDDDPLELSARTLPYYVAFLQQAKIGAVFVDTFADWIGTEDLDKAGIMRKLMHLVRCLCKQTGVAICAAVHPNKTKPEVASQNITRIANSYMIGAKCDAGGVLEEIDEELVSLQMLKNRPANKWKETFKKMENRFYPIDYRFLSGIQKDLLAYIRQQHEIRQAEIVDYFIKAYHNSKPTILKGLKDLETHGEIAKRAQKNPKGPDIVVYVALE